MTLNGKKWLQFVAIATLCITVATTTNLTSETANTFNQSATENTTDYRLPDNVIPLTYYIHITPFFKPNNFTFNGTVKIIANVKNRTSKIVLHASRLDINNVNVINLSNKSLPISVKNITKTEKYDFLNIILKSPIHSGENISIKINYSGELGTVQEGFFRRSYKFKNETRWLAGTHMEPIGARKTFPCFDEPGLKAEFYINVTAPKNYTALSNMPVKSISNDNTFEFERSPRMSTYTVAVTVSDFQSLEDNKGKTLFRIWANPGSANQLSYSLDLAKKAIKFYEDQLSIPYSLPKMDLFAMPDYVSAMENWGLTIYNENMLLYKAKDTSLSNRKIVRGIVVHELFHQWTGNLVTPEWWDYLWLSESFAAYSEYHTLNELEPSLKLESQFVVNELQTSFAYDDAESKPMTRAVYSPGEIGATFDAIVYAKGACILRMFRKLLGSKMFFGGLRRYLLKNQYSTGTPEKLFAGFEEEIKSNDYDFGISVFKFMNSWTRKPGYPVVNAYLDGNILHLKQKRFLLKPVENETIESVWAVPISYATASDPNFNETKKVFWFTQNQSSIIVPNGNRDWIILNIQQTGYYRVNYDREMWNRIITVLKSKDFSIIHEINRAALMDDLLNFGRVGAVNYSTVFSATQYLINETSYLPWKATFEGFQYLKTRFTGHSEIYRLFKNYVINLIEPIYRKLGFKDKVGEELIDVDLREYVLDWLCNFEYKDCINKTLEEFKRLRQNNSYNVPANSQKIVYAMGIKYGSTDDWNYLWHKFGQSDFVIEKDTILNALAHSQNPTNLERLFNSSISPESAIDVYSVPIVFSYAARASVLGAQTALDFINRNYKRILDYTKDESAFTEPLKYISTYISTNEFLEKFNKFLEDNEKIMEDVTEEMQNSYKNALYEIKWYNQYSPNILQWLKSNQEKV